MKSALLALAPHEPVSTCSPAFSKAGCTIFPQFPQLRFAVLTYVLTLA